MTEEEREAFYDREIAPELMKLAKKCEGEGLSFVAMVEWSPDHNAKTISIRAGCGIATRMVLWAAQANGNADALIAQLIRHGEEHGHNSAYLHLLEWA